MYNVTYYVQGDNDPWRLDDTLAAKAAVKADVQGGIMFQFGMSTKVWIDGRWVHVRKTPLSKDESTRYWNIFGD